MAKLKVTDFGLQGVNVDKNPFELATGELTQAQNAMADPASGKSSLRKREGLVSFTQSTTAGDVLGGIGVPAINLRTGVSFLYIGRGILS